MGLYHKYFEIRQLIKKRFFKKYWANQLFLNSFGRKINWKYPQDLNEVINYLEFHTDTREWSRLSDKILVREYVKEKGLEDILVPLLGVWNDPQDINFDKLPERFVLKCNHDSGSTHIINKSEVFDQKNILSELRECLNRKFGDINNEPHYNAIKPKVLAEAYIDFDINQHLSTSPIDYKIWCYNGNPDIVFVVYNRNKYFLNYEIRDLEWGLHLEYAVEGTHYQPGKGIIPKPKGLNKMIEYARILSQGFPQVRVDFYYEGGKIYFGEMTFTSDCGRMTYFSDLYLKLAARKINITL